MSLGNEIRIGGVKAASETGSIRAPSVGGGSAMRSGTAMERGATGPMGPQGPKGDTGATGPAGADGVSVTHRWNGTVLEVTSASGTSSADLKGDPGTVTAVKVAGETHEPDDTGVVDLGQITGGADLSDDAPAPLGTAAAGTSELAARADHMHKMPTAAQVGAATAEEVGQLKYEMVTLPEGEETPGDAPTINADTLGWMTVSQFVDMIYPVGSIYMSASSTSPETLFGGTWESIGGRFLLGADETYTAGSKGGVSTHKHNLPLYTDKQNTFNFNEILPWNKWNYVSAEQYTSPNVYKFYDEAGTSHAESYTGYLAASAPESNMPPYLAVYMWQRTA